MKLNTFYRAAIYKIGLPKTLIRIMKLTTLLLIIAFVQASAASYGQKINLQEKNATLAKVLQSIKAQTGYVFFSKDFDLDKPIIDVNLKDASLEEALDACFKNLPIEYKVVDKTVFLTEKESSILDKIKTVLAIPFTVTGTVQDETNRPLPGVTVRIKGADNGTVTDARGYFSLTVPEDKTIISFSYIGYETQELRGADITKGAVIILKTATNNLHEVVINKGYYNERQELSTGDVSRVTAKEIEQQPVANALAALEGRVPGLIITQTTGLPGGGFTAQIRGQNSIANGNDPFYVIDGVPYNSQLTGGANSLLNSALKGGNPLNFINPYDIENIEVLKDADATTIYGSRAANGAIIITTKKGKAGAMKIDLNLNSGFTNPARQLQVLNTQQYLIMRNQAFKNDAATPGPGDHDVNGDWDTTHYTNWSKVLTNNPAHYNSYDASISGGNTNTQYLIGAGYTRQTSGSPSIVLQDQGADQRASVHFNINSMSDNKKFKIALTGSYVSNINTINPTNLTFTALTLPPDAPQLYNPDGTLNWAPKTPGQVGTFSNPLANLYIQDKGTTSNLVSNLVLSYTLLTGLELKTSLGYTNTQTNESQITPTTVFDPGQNRTSGISEFNESNSHGWIFEPQADYVLNFGKGKLTALIGGSFNEIIQTQQGLYATGFTSDALLSNIQAASSVYPNGTNFSQYKYEAVFGRLNYNWDDKYLVNLTARRDGSSRFGPGKQFADFGAVGAGWIFSKEKLIEENLPFLSFGKLRASYGTTGNDQIGDYSFLDLYSPTAFPYQGNQALYSQTLFNPNLEWEVDKKLEGGIEIGIFKNRINIQASFYRNRSSNQLVSTPTSLVTGFGNIQTNLPAVVQNSGFEYLVNTINIKSKNFIWSSSFNLTIASNKLVSFPDLASSVYSQSLIIGQPTTIIKAYHLIDVNPTTGLYQFEGANGQPTYSPNYQTDRPVFININPKFYGGFQNSFSYKDFTLDFIFQFVKQTGENLFGIYQPMPGTQFNQPVNYSNAWQTPGDRSKYQMYSQNYGSLANTELYYAHQSDFAYSDASFIRLKNLAMSWSLPENWKRKMRLQNCRLFLKGQNLLTITKYNGIDPESGGLSTSPMRTWTMGLQVTF